MSQHDNQPWPWPTREEGERLTALLQEPGVLISEHRHPAMIHVKHPDGTSLWATVLDPHPTTSERLPQGPLPSLATPVVAETREALSERIATVGREARIHGAQVQARSPLRKNPYLEAEIERLIER